jgi:predicted esterase
VNVESTAEHEDEKEGEGRARTGLELKCGKVLMVVGKEDTVIRSYEHVPDAMACLGELNLEVLELEAGHEVPVTKSEEIVEWVWANWTEGDA